MRDGGKSYTLTTTLSATIDNRLDPSPLLCIDREPSRIPAGKLRALVLKAFNAGRKDIGYLLPSVDVQYETKHLFGLWTRRQSVRLPVSLIDMKHVFNSKNHLVVTMRWKIVVQDGVDVPTVSQIRAALSGGLTDGWGEGVEQAARFGPIVECDDDDVCKLVPKTAITKSMQAYDHGQYALLFTLRDSQVHVAPAAMYTHRRKR